MAKNVLKELRLNEISAVDFPAQEGARMTIMKRGRPEAVVKGMYAVAETATDTVDTQSFAELLASNEAQRAAWEANEQLWPLFSALQDAISNVARDTTLDAAAKTERARQNVQDFMNAVADKIPDVEQELEKAVLHFVAADKGGDHARHKEKAMADEAKKIADLEKTVADLTKANADLVTKHSAEVAAITKAKDDAAKDEIIKVGEVEVRKSAVGDATFAVIKAQQAEIAKEREARELVEFTKRAETEFPSLPGEPVAKAKVLKAVATLDKADGDALTVMLKSGEEAMKARMRETGHGGGGVILDSAEARMNKMASELSAKDSISIAKAHDKLSQSSADYQKAYADHKAEMARRAKAA